MGSIVVCGGSVIGLSVAMMLAADGHQVTVLEANPQGVPADSLAAWDSWERKGVAQFHQPHTLFARFRHILDEELPGMVEKLVAAGGEWMDPLDPMPPTISDPTPRPGDDRFKTIAGRRPMIESVIAAAAENQPGVSVRRGVRVAGLLPGPSAIPGTPGTAGVRTATGEELRADLVIDATGRRTPSADWLAELALDVRTSSPPTAASPITPSTSPAPRARNDRVRR